jgi:CheY-like chemotaxis protein
MSAIWLSRSCAHEGCDSIVKKSPQRMCTTQVKTILVVDDDRVFVSQLSSALRASGYTVLSAHAVRDAYTILDSASFDLAVIDLDLPDKSGLELIHNFSKRATRAKILATSGVLSELHLEIARYMGASQAIRKFPYAVTERFPAADWNGVVAELLT